MSWWAGELVGHPLKAGHPFVCHTVLRFVSKLHRPQIRTEALNDKKKESLNCPALSGWPS